MLLDTHAWVRSSDIHRDPADRFIIATAVVARCPLLTLDESVRKYPELVELLT